MIDRRDVAVGGAVVVNQLEGPGRRVRLQAVDVDPCLYDVGPARVDRRRRIGRTRRQRQLPGSIGDRLDHERGDVAGVVVDEDRHARREAAQIRAARAGGPGRGLQRERSRHQVRSERRLRRGGRHGEQGDGIGPERAGRVVPDDALAVR